MNTTVTTATQPGTRGSSSRFLLLDLLRLAAALAVVLFHFTGREMSQWGEPVHVLFPILSKFTVYGFLGVPLFFLISGFVIFMSFDGQSLRKFVAARVSRLYPAYWTAVITTAILVTFIAPQLNKTVTLPQLLINLTMFQTPLRVENIDGVYWTLWVELTFYLLIAALIFFRANEKLFIWFIFIWPLLGLSISLSGIGFLAHGLGTRHSSFFAAGMCLYLLHKNGSKCIVWLLFFMNAGIGIGLAMSAPAPGPAGQPVLPLITAIVLLACFVAIAVVTLTPLKFRGGSWMLRAGALTYPLYLVHQYWGWWIIGLVNPIAGRWIAVVVAIALVILFAYCIERWVERPLRPRLRNLVSGKGFVGPAARLGDIRHG